LSEAVVTTTTDDVVDGMAGASVVVVGVAVAADVVGATVDDGAEASASSRAPVVVADPPVESCSTPVHSAAGAPSPGTFNTTGEPRVTNVPARGNCSTTVPETPSRPSTTSTMAGDPMVLSTPAANWTVFPTTDGTSNNSGESSNSGTAPSSSEQAAINTASNTNATRAFSHLQRCPAPATRPMTRVSQTNDPPLRTCILRGPTE